MQKKKKKKKKKKEETRKEEKKERNKQARKKRNNTLHPAISTKSQRCKGEKTEGPRLGTDILSTKDTKKLSGDFFQLQEEELLFLTNEKSMLSS